MHSAVATPSSARRPWTPPAVVDLPPLRDLTLQTVGIPGDTEPGTLNF